MNLYFFINILVLFKIFEKIINCINNCRATPTKKSLNYPVNQTTMGPILRNHNFEK